jgi:hypothetical protein
MRTTQPSACDMGVPRNFCARWQRVDMVFKPNCHPKRAVTPTDGCVDSVVPMDERGAGRILKTLTFSHISVPPAILKPMPQRKRRIKKLPRPGCRRDSHYRTGQAARVGVAGRRARGQQGSLIRIWAERGSRPTHLGRWNAQTRAIFSVPSVRRAASVPGSCCRTPMSTP